MATQESNWNSMTCLGSFVQNSKRVWQNENGSSKSSNYQQKKQNETLAKV